MAVVNLSRFSGGKRDAMIAAAKQAKAAHEKAGAELFQLGQIHTGPWAGQWLVTIRWADWKSYGKGQQALADNTEFQKLMADVVAMATLESRTLGNTLDL
jgi:hypothetical protein